MNASDKLNTDQQRLSEELDPHAQFLNAVLGARTRARIDTLFQSEMETVKAERRVRG